jgi:hypothetical protein
LKFQKGLKKMEAKEVLNEDVPSDDDGEEPDFDEDALFDGLASMDDD